MKWIKDKNVYVATFNESDIQDLLNGSTFPFKTSNDELILIKRE